MLVLYWGRIFDVIGSCVGQDHGCESEDPEAPTGCRRKLFGRAVERLSDEPAIEEGSCQKTLRAASCKEM